MYEINSQVDTRTLSPTPVKEELNSCQAKQTSVIVHGVVFIEAGVAGGRCETSTTGFSFYIFISRYIYIKRERERERERESPFSKL
jgi:hypothetical protein